MKRKTEMAWVRLIFLCLVVLSLILGCVWRSTVSADPLRGSCNLKQTFHDEFDGESLDSSKWTTRFWWGDGYINDGSLNYYTDENVSVSQGAAHIKVEKRAVADKPYASSMISTYGKFTQTYGYWEVKAKIVSGNGLSSFFGFGAFDRSWPPEIDVFEIPQQERKVFMTNHYDADNKSNEGTWESPVALSRDYHTYGLLWRSSLLVFYIDGQERWRTTVGVATKNLVPNMGVGVCGGWCGDVSKVKLPRVMDIDYFRVYSENCLKSATAVTPTSNRR